MQHWLGKLPFCPGLCRNFSLGICLFWFSLQWCMIKLKFFHQTVSYVTRYLLLFHCFFLGALTKKLTYQKLSPIFIRTPVNILRIKIEENHPSHWWYNSAKSPKLDTCRVKLWQKGFPKVCRLWHYFTRIGSCHTQKYKSHHSTEKRSAQLPSTIFLRSTLLIFFIGT